MVKKNKTEERDPIEKRLDVLIKFEIQRMRRELGKEFNLQEPAKILQSSDFSPSEIASILNKKGATAVAYLLYGNNEIKEEELKQEESNLQEEDKEEVIKDER